MTTTEVETVEKTSDIDERVNRGAAYLDEHQPGWMEYIDLPKLNMDSCYDCVIGQVMGDYALAVLAGINTRSDNADHGFTIYSGESFLSWGELESAWKKLITQRREGGESFLS